MQLEKNTMHVHDSINYFCNLFAGQVINFV